FTAKTAKKSLLRPAVDLYDGAGSIQTVGPQQRVSKPTIGAINNWLVPVTGRYLLGIRGTSAGPTGLYELTTKAKAAPKVKPVAGSIDAVGEIDEIAFDAVADTKATFSLKRGKRVDLTPRVVEIVAPDGTTLALDTALRKSTAT